MTLAEQRALKNPTTRLERRYRKAWVLVRDIPAYKRFAEMQRLVLARARRKKAVENQKRERGFIAPYERLDFAWSLPPLPCDLP